MHKPTSIIGRYEIIREIARSNDVVYEAWDPTMQRRVALKELLIPAGSSPTTIQERVTRFHREAAAAGRLSHPNIATIYDHGVDGDKTYIVMEFVSGPTLGDVIAQRAPLPPDECLKILAGLLDALDCAHRAHIVHRDIKPHNIFLLDDGTVKLADFGIAKVAHEPIITLRNEILGTPHYMSPEQARGEDIDVRSDLWAAGVILYEMASGYKPFLGANAFAILESVRLETPNTSLIHDATVKKIVETLLAKDAAQRFQSAGEVLKAIAARSVQTAQKPAPPLVHPPPARAPQIILPPAQQVGPALSSVLLKPPIADPVRTNVNWMLGTIGGIILLWIIAAVFSPAHSQTKNDPYVPTQRSGQESVPRSETGAPSIQQRSDGWSDGTMPPASANPKGQDVPSKKALQVETKDSAENRSEKPQWRSGQADTLPSKVNGTRSSLPLKEPNTNQPKPIQPKVNPDDVPPPTVGDSSPSTVKPPPP